MATPSTKSWDVMLHDFQSQAPDSRLGFVATHSEGRPKRGEPLGSNPVVAAGAGAEGGADGCPTAGAALEKTRRPSSRRTLNQSFK